MKNDQPLFLNEEQVRQHLHMAELIPAMEKALIEFSGGKVTQPVRSVINVDPPGGFLGLMPALTPDGLGWKAMSAEEAVRGADVVVTTTNSKMPVLKGSWLKPGSHVNAIGACRPDWRELDDDAMSNVVFVDSREGALQESGDMILSGAKVYAELGEALAAEVPSRANETTIFKSLGMAVEDIAAALLVYRSVKTTL